MLVILLLLALFVPALCFRSSVKIPNDVQMQKAIAPLLLGALIAGAISLVVGVYTFLQMRKMQKKNQPKPNQLDGTIADEGISFYDLAGSPHVHTNITDIWDKDAQAIKKKSGGFLGMGKTSQVTGYRYYAKFAAFIGNRIEKFLAINFDNRGWILHDPLKHPDNLLPIEKPSLYGEDEGGVSGNIDIHFGYPDQEPNAEYQKYFPLVSGYPYQSYLVFRSLTGGAPSLGQGLSPAGFYLGNSGYMKEMLLWVKRIYVKNNGDVQWHKPKAGIPDFYYQGGGEYPPKLDIFASYTGFISNQPEKITEQHLEQKSWNSIWSISGMVSTNWPINYPYDVKQDWMIAYSSGEPIFIELIINIMNNSPNTKANIGLYESGDIVVISSESWDEDTPENYGKGQFQRIRAMLPAKPSGKATLTAMGKLEAGLIAWHKGWLTWVDPVKGKEWLERLDAFDINPIHKIREILTDDTAMGKPESDINDINFIKAADRIYDEGLGVSWAIDEKSCIDAIEELCYHIEAGVRVNRQTGLYEMVLFRDNWFSEEEIHDIAENKIKNLSLEIMNSDDIVNQLNVTYYDRERIKNSAFSVYENGSILTIGHVNAESVDFPYFMNMRNAEIVANWKLKQFSTPAWSGSFTTGWREARKWNRYDLIRLPWSKKWNGTILVRIMKINLGNGTDNTVTIDFEEIVPYSGEMNTSIVADESLNQGTLPPQPCQYEPFELPYYLILKALGQRRVDDELAYESNFGLVGVVAEKPQSNSIYAIMMTHDETEGEEWTRAATIDYSPTADLDQTISKTATSLTVKNRKNLTDLPSGTLIKCGSDWIGMPGEFMVLQSIDAYTGIITVKRGALDTMPQLWGPNVKLYFCGSDIPLDETEYVLGEKVLVSALTTTPSGVLEQKGSIPVEIQARAIRPYPPANVKLNGVYFPETHLVTRDLTITWADRNRLQQTGGELLGFYDAGVTVEPGVTYSYELSSGNSILEAKTDLVGNLAVIPTSLLIPNKPHTLKLWSTRDGYDSYQKFEHSFFVEAASLILTASTDGSKVSGNTVPAASISIDVDASLKANMRSDGSSISGKAQAGSTITIEVEE